MNIFLVPYTWWRHLQVATLTSAFALLAWWLSLTWFCWIGPFWTIEWDGAIFLTAVATGTAAASVIAESTLRRQPLRWRISRTVLAALLSGGLALVWYWLWTMLSAPALFSSFPEDIGEPSLVSLRFRLGAFAMTGVSVAVGPGVVRRGRALLTHFAAGVSAGLASGAVWHFCNYPLYNIFGDLYLASGLAALAFGGVFGLLSWGIPDELYAGWLRVLSPTRFGYRIPVDAMDRSPKERFVGHFPRGLDMWAPVDDGVMELHLSVFVDAQQRYRARGLTLRSTVVRRFLERIDIRYDPRRPAPLETRLSSGDRLTLGDEAQASTTVEFIMLPREER